MSLDKLLRAVNVKIEKQRQGLAVGFVPKGVVGKEDRVETITFREQGK